MASGESSTLIDAQAERDRGHGIATGVVYGPVESRRYGLDYGVNLLPPGKKHRN